MEPRSFSGLDVRQIATNGTILHVRVGGQGPALVMLHGFGDTGDMWRPLADALADKHGRHPRSARHGSFRARRSRLHEKETSLDIAGVLNNLRIEKADLVTHDIGNMVGYAFAAQFPDRVTSWVAMDAPLPGIGNWEQIARDPRLWHFNFRGPDA
ncbi:MAG TPA: alpha/beta fold hydrolase [Stellaceae bacterium]|nr:alpha/beta fold hydrolase [Stellaceae bacterium]